jgi:hypothetical protein
VDEIVDDVPIMCLTCTDIDEQGVDAGIRR